MCSMFNVTAGRVGCGLRDDLAPAAGCLRQRQIRDIGSGNAENQQRHRRKRGQEHQHDTPVKFNSRAGNRALQISALVKTCVS